MMMVKLLALLLLLGAVATVNAQSQGPYMVFASKDTIYQVNLDGTDLQVLENQSYSIAIDYDIRRNYLFWTDVLVHRIMWANLDGSQPRVLVSNGLNITDGLAWDWMNEKLYWTDTDRKIEVYDISSGQRKKLIDTGVDSIPRGIVLDPETRYMYWTDWGQPAKIERASMDGTARETLHSTSLIWPNDITIDYQSQTIYWIDASLDKLESSHVTGLNRRVLSRELIVHPFSLTIYNGTIYWSDWGYRRVIFASLSNIERVFGLVPVLSNDPTGVRVVALDAQPINSPNPCSIGNGGCSHLCLLTASGNSSRSCNCPMELELDDDGLTCIGRQLPTITLTGSPIDSGYFTGLQLTLTCSIHIPSVLASLPTTVSAQWTKSGSILLTNSRMTVGEVLVMGPGVYQTSLVFNSLDRTRGDEGTYTCSANIADRFGSRISTASATSNITIATAFFQLRLSGMTDCLSWRSHTTSAKDMDIVEAIVDNVVQRCGCNFREDRVTDRVFQCFQSSPHTVTYHAQLHGTLQANVSQLLTAMQEWFSSVDTIAVQFLPLSVESFCTVTSSSPLERCPDDVIMRESPTAGTITTAETTNSQTTNNQTTNSDEANVASNQLSITVAVVAVSVVVIVILVIVALAAILVSRSRHSSVNIQNDNTKFPPAGTILEQNYALAFDDPAAHQYEEISKYNKTAWTVETVPKSSQMEFSISQCPAYTSTPKSVRPPELEYDEVRTVSVHGQRPHAVDYEVVQMPSEGQRSANVVMDPPKNKVRGRK